MPIYKTLRQKLQFAPDPNMSAAIMYLAYCNAGIGVVLTPEIEVEIKRLSGLNDEEFENLVVKSIAARKN